MRRVEPNRFAPVEERQALGKSRRQVISRVDQGLWRLPESRCDPIEILKRAHRGRREDLLPIKYGRMAASPFAFFRGAVPVMAADLSTLRTTGIHAQLCGDAHVRNLGAFAAPDGHLLFDINDFDETIQGPWEWDLKRLATSFILAGREAGASEGACCDAVEALVRCYREKLAAFAEMPAFELFRYEIRRVRGTGPVQAVLQKAERATPLHTLKRLTVRAPGGLRRFARRPPLLEPVPAGTARNVFRSLQSYRDTVSEDRQLVLDAYRPVDVALKVVGVGSVGTRDYAVLCFGATPNDPLFLQVKEEPPSCYAPYLSGAPAPAHQGRRVAEAQHRMQTVSDPFLGWTTIDERDYLVRQLSDHKAAVEPEQLAGAALMKYGTVCGEVFAKAHARTGDPAVLSGYCGTSDKLDTAMRRFAIAYSDQTTADHERLLKAIKQGQIKARRGI